MINVGVIGAGVMGASHVKTLAGLGGVRVTAVADIDASRAAQAAGLAEGASVLTPAELIRAASVDAVVVASPDALHAEQVLACLDLGKPVLCEKPLAATRAEAQAIAARDKGLDLVQVGFMRRYDPDYLDLRRQLQSGTIGDPLLLRMIHRNAAAPAFMAGFQGITNAMVHEFDILRWLTGDEVARIRVLSPRIAPSLMANKALFDPLLATIETVGGLLVEVEFAANVLYGYDIGTEILGTRGALRMAARPSTQSLTAGGARISYPMDFTQRFEEAYRLQFTDWVRSLAAQRGRGAGASAEDGVVALGIAEAGIKALESGDWVDVA